MYGLSTSGEIKLQFTPFWGGGKQGWSDSVRVGIIKSHNFFCLTFYPDEIAHSNLANRELFNDFLDVVVRGRKVALHTISRLMPIEA